MRLGKEKGKAVLFLVSDCHTPQSHHRLAIHPNDRGNNLVLTNRSEETHLDEISYLPNVLCIGGEALILLPLCCWSRPPVDALIPVFGISVLSMAAERRR